jgi:GNAT superfamily N-acetyltransferase
MIEVREGTTEDADECAAAHIEGWRTGYRNLLPDAFLDAPEFATQRIERWRAWTWADGLEGAALFVAERHGRVVGFVTCGPERVDPVCDQLGRTDAVAVTNGRGEVYAFYLHPDAWGSGAAAALMARCRQYLADNGFAHAVLWVLRDNPRARRFYERSGWSATGRETMFEGPQTAAKLTEPLPEVEYRLVVD